MGKYCLSAYLHSQYPQLYLPTLLHVSCWKMHWLAHRCAIVASSSSHICEDKYVYLRLLLRGTHCNWNSVWASVFIIVIILIIFTIIIFVIFQNCCKIYNITNSKSSVPVLQCYNEFYNSYRILLASINIFNNTAMFLYTFY